MKICYTCKVEKEESLFHKKNGGKLQSNCIDCHKKYVNNHYLLNKEKYKEKTAKNRKKAYESYREYKESLSCTDCNLSFKGKPYLCDFHHINENKDVSPSILSDSKKRFFEEIKNCIPLCANCHRIRHNS